MDHVVRLRPQRVLDVGAGFGKWGYLAREALDFMAGRIERGEWRTVIHGIDAFPHHSPLWEWVYDAVTVGHALELRHSLAKYDLVILGDVIEHLTKEDGLILIRTLLAQNRHVIVTTPLDFFDQEIGDNTYERHLSLWTRSDFNPWSHDYDVVGGAAIVVLLAGKGATYPTARTTLRSTIAYSVPGMARHEAMPHMVKTLLGRVLNDLPPLDHT